VVLHGFPGTEQNTDLAHALSRAGYAALVFHYRGSWGMGGTWSWSNVLEDAACVVSTAMGPEFAAAHRIDPTRTAVIGHSLGGFAALRTAAALSGVAVAGSIAGFNFGAVAPIADSDARVRAAYVEAFEDSLLPLAGTGGEALVDEMAAAGEAWDLALLADRLADRPVLLIAGAYDDVAPSRLHHDPVVAAYTAHPVPGLLHIVFPTDHALADHRVALARTVIAFLDQHLHAPR